eukprot:7327758-Pyramimonas_sp.AAC.1
MESGTCPAPGGTCAGTGCASPGRRATGTWIPAATGAARRTARWFCRPAPRAPGATRWSPAAAE